MPKRGHVRRSALPAKRATGGVPG